MVSCRDRRDTDTAGNTPQHVTAWRQPSGADDRQTDRLWSPVVSEQSRTPRYLTVGEVAALLRVDVFTVRRWIGRGQLEGYLIGRTYRVTAAALDAFVEARRVQPRQPARD